MLNVTSVFLQKIPVLPSQGWFFGFCLSINIYFVFFFQDVIIANDFFKQCCQLMAFFRPFKALKTLYLLDAYMLLKAS